jgi:hypothetical protein
MLMVASGVAKANIYGYSSLRNRVRWSPYAFSHKQSGLVSGYLRYSPYAFNHKNPSGLIDEYARYTPYAFSHKNSGLVYDAYSRSCPSYYAPYYRIQRAPVVVVHSVRQPPCAPNYKYSQSSNKTNNSYRQKLIARRQRIKKLRDSRKQINMAKEKDAKEIICRYLNSRNINDFEMTGILRIDGKTVNINFLLRDKNIMITYWDLDEVQSLVQQSEYKRNYLEKHEQEWKNLCKKYTQTGGNVYPITSADENEILVKLMLCPELNDG